MNRQQLTTIAATAAVMAIIAVVVYFVYFHEGTQQQVQPTTQDVPPPMKRVIPLADTVMVLITWEDSDHTIKRDVGKYIRHGVGHQVGNRYVYDSVMREEVQKPVYIGKDTAYVTISNSKVIGIRR